MGKHLHNESYIDHFLQADILSKLASSDEPVRFSDLKQDGIENSLFMYHANKLISRGLIDKTDAGFALTVLVTSIAIWAAGLSAQPAR